MGETEGSGRAAECPECGYETFVFEQDIIETVSDAGRPDYMVEKPVLRCPECDPHEVGDPLTNRTPQLELVDGA